MPMSFAEDVKNELCQYEASSDADVAMKIEASCLLRMGGSIINDHLVEDNTLRYAVQC